MKFSFHREAEREFDIAVEYYEGCRPGLGLEFAAEVYAAIKRTRSILKRGRQCPGIRGAAF